MEIENMARRVISLEEKINKAQAEVSSAKDRYDNAVAELEKLLTKRRELEAKELLNAFAASDRSLDEVIAFLRNESYDVE